MSNNDDIIDTPEGLGHDPLEWLQDDEEDTSAQTASQETASASSQETASQPSTELETAEVEATDLPDITAACASQPESLPEPEPQASTADNQSYTFDNHKAILTLPEKLTVQIIEPLHSEWKTLLYDLPQSLEVDASQVKDIDAAGMQLFYALVQQMVFKGSDVVILNVHASLKRHFELFGLDDFFAQYIHAA